MKSGDEWQTEPSGPSAEPVGGAPELQRKMANGFGEFRIPIRAPRAGARGASHEQEVRSQAAGQ